MPFCLKLRQPLFPYDFSQVNHRGDWCFEKKQSYTGFRIIMLLLYAIDFSYCAWFFQKKDLLYFTNWGLILTMLCALILLVQNLISRIYQNRIKMKIWKVSHFIFTLIFVFEMFITGVYWCGIFPYAVIHLWGHLGVYDIVNPIMAHGVPVLLLFVDLQFNLINIWSAAFVPYYYIVLIIYFIVNFIYTLKVQAIYDILTYQNWFSFMFLIICGTVILICHVLARLYCKYCKQKRLIKILQNADVKLFKQPEIDLQYFWDQSSQDYGGYYKAIA